MPISGKTNQPNKQKLSSNFTLYEAYTNHWANLRRTETKRKKQFSLEAWEKETTNTIFKKIIIIIMKRQRNTTEMKEQTGNTEAQINEEEIGKPLEKELRIMIVKMVKNLENKM